MHEAARTRISADELIAGPRAASESLAAQAPTCSTLDFGRSDIKRTSSMSRPLLKDSEGRRQDHATRTRVATAFFIVVCVGWLEPLSSNQAYRLLTRQDKQAGA